MSDSVRLIPTHAGKTGWTWRGPPGPQAHPHSRGENIDIIDETPLPEGSSPLTRGKLTNHEKRIITKRLIPTHAGKTRASRATWPGPRAHPHSRGENTRRVPFHVIPTGSSPLTRGKHLAIQVRLAARGLIPTHAGKTPCNPGTPGGARAHPHSRGENRLEELSYLPGPGSSPLTRGKHDAGQGRQRDHGLIPTHAGKTAPNFRPA